MPGFDIQEVMTMFGNIIHTEWGNIRLPKRKKEKLFQNNVEYYTDEKGNIRRRKKHEAANSR